MRCPMYFVAFVRKIMITFIIRYIINRIACPYQIGITVHAIKKKLNARGIMIVPTELNKVKITLNCELLCVALQLLVK